MIKDNKLLDDLARVASGAASTANDVRTQAQADMRERLERLFNRSDLARNEDLEAVREMATKARQEQEALAKRVKSLETRLAALEGGSSQSAGTAKKSTSTSTSSRTRAGTSQGRSTASSSKSGTSSGSSKSSSGKSSSGGSSKSSGSASGKSSGSSTSGKSSSSRGTSGGTSGSTR